MKKLGYGSDYKYAHAYEDHFVEDEYFPAGLEGTQFYFPQDNPAEEKIKDRLDRLWKDKYKAPMPDE